MPESSSPPPASATLRLRLTLLLLMALPCLPGLTFLLAGMLIDPHGRPRDFSPAGETRDSDQRERARSLYLAGGSVLMVGTFGMAMVLWKIARPGRPYDEETRFAAAREIVE